MHFGSAPFALLLAGSIVSAAVLAAVPTPARAEACVQVEVQNVRADTGVLMIAAYADAASFRKTPVAATQMKAGTATMTVPLCGLAGASVALTLYQDLNGNGRLDTNAFGIPSEPWGASGKTGGAMTPPTWESSAVPLDGSTIVVKLSK